MDCPPPTIERRSTRRKRVRYERRLTLQRAIAQNPIMFYPHEVAHVLGVNQARVLMWMSHGMIHRYGGSVDITGAMAGYLVRVLAESFGLKYDEITEMMRTFDATHGIAGAMWSVVMKHDVRVGVADGRLLWFDNVEPAANVPTVDFGRAGRRVFRELVRSYVNATVIDGADSA